jgi:hypothetical protein
MSQIFTENTPGPVVTFYRFAAQTSAARLFLGPVNAICANANGVKTVPIKAREDAQTGRLG